LLVVFVNLINYAVYKSNTKYACNWIDYNNFILIIQDD